MCFDRDRFLGLLLIAALIGCVAMLCQGAEPKSDAELLQGLIQNGEEDVQKSNATLEAATALAKQIKADAEQSARDDEENPYSVGDKNFIIAAVGRSFSESLLKTANQLRSALALRYLGKELPPRKEFAIVRIEIDDEVDERCETWLCGKGRAMRGANRIWITAATRERAAELLEHAIEVVVCGGKPRLTERE
jgi:hypothetical protein